MEALLKSGTGGGSGGSDGAEDGCPGETDLVDRLASEVNHLNFLVSHCEGAALLKVFKPRVAEVCQFVERGLERGLREGVLNKDLGLLRRTLRTYASLGSTNHVHTLIRHLIRKELAEVVCVCALSFMCICNEGIKKLKDYCTVVMKKGWRTLIEIRIE